MFCGSSCAQTSCFACRIFAKQFLNARAWERIKLFESDDGYVFFGCFLSRFHQIVVDLATAENNAFHSFCICHFGIVDHRMKTAAA